MTRTVGIDLAAQPARTALAVVVWDPGSAAVSELIRPAFDDQIVAAVQDCDRAGLDVPLGWPAPFTAFITAHQGDTHAPLPDADAWRDLAYRETDRVVAESFRKTPLSVSTDRIGLAAFRGATLLARLRDAGVDVSRDGTGRILEAYPAVALMQWGLGVNGPYKGTDRGRASANLTLLVDALLTAAPWLDLGPHEERCRSNDDAFDAVICALIARAHHLGLCTAPTREQQQRARTEGWIAVPEAPLAALLT
jgi:predicted nuclease with RNAse H fold